MKLTRLQIKNFVGIEKADIDFDSPATLIIGANNQGKSSVRDAIEFAFTGKCRAGTKWKDAKELCRGEGRMGVKLAYQDGDEPATAMRTSSTASNGADERPVLRYCLKPIEFIRLDPRQRAKILAEVCGGGAAKLAKAAIQKHIGKIDKSILAELKERTVDFTDVDVFREAVCELRREFKRAAKEESRAPLMQDYQLEPEFNAKQCEAKIEELAGRIKKGGDLIAEAKAKQKVQAEILDLEGQIKKLVKPKRLPKKPTMPVANVNMADVYLTLIQDLITDNPADEPCCPLCDRPNQRKAFEARIDVLTTFLAEHQGAAEGYEAAVTAKAHYDKLIKTMRDRLGALHKQDNEVKLPTGSETLLADLTAERDTLQGQIGSYALFQQAKKTFEKKQEIAKEYAGLIEECDRIDKCLKDGGPVKAAIAAGGTKLPINDKLLELWGMEALQLIDTGNITLRSVRIETCSGSEKYRASCVMGMALAQLSGIGVVALDGFSILDRKNKNAFMQVAEDCGLETILLFATDTKDYTERSVPNWLSIYTVKDGNVEAI